MDEEYESILGSADVAGPADSDLIKEAEEQLGLTFPSEYRSFLEQFGAAMGFGFQIAGIFRSESDGPPLWTHVALSNTQKRRFLSSQWPQSLFCIADDGSEVSYWIDATDDAPSCKVQAHGPNVDGVIVAESLKEFIVRFAAGELFIG